MPEEMVCVSRTICPGMEEVSPRGLRYRCESHRVVAKVAEMRALSVKPVCIFAFLVRSFIHLIFESLDLLRKEKSKQFREEPPQKGFWL